MKNKPAQKARSGKEAKNVKKAIKTVRVNDQYQTGYSYTLVEPMGKNFDPEFKPQLTPKQMLALGIFGGLYFSDRTKELPADWYAKAKLQHLGMKADPKLNLFKINASQPLSVWKKNGWIYKDDPRGWFQWYCRYYMGRRIPAEDARQIKRWKAINRHIAQVSYACQPGDMFCRPKQKQAILHWAYDARRL